MATKIPGYKNLEYIESTGTQWINTGIVYTANSKFELKWTKATGYFFGGFENDSKRFTLIGGENAKVGIGSLSSSKININNINNTIIDCSTWKVFNNDTEILQATSYLYSRSLYLFAWNRFGGTPSFWGAGKSYAFKHYENEVLEHNFEPKLRMADMKPGMYDTINDVFYTNQGSGEFLIPPLNVSEQEQHLLYKNGEWVPQKQMLVKVNNLWKKVWPKYAGLCFTAKEDGSSVSYYVVGRTTDLKYSTNGIDWTQWAADTPITLNNGQFIYVKGSNLTTGLSSGQRTTFITTGKIAASGNCNSVLDDKDGSTITTIRNNCYRYLFYECENLYEPPELPALSVGVGSYAYMFKNCTNLKTAPNLPATSISENCYQEMFFGCSSLEFAPELPSQTVYFQCYDAMFENCTSLVAAPQLPAIEVAVYCYHNMFSGCSALKVPPQLPATILKSNCYQQMFRNCSSLKVKENDSTSATLLFECPDLTGLTAPVGNMFYRTGGSFTGTPTAGNSYYWYE